MVRTTTIALAAAVQYKRRERGVSIDQTLRRTNQVDLAVLRSLEEDDGAHLPREIAFTLGFHEPGRRCMSWRGLAEITVRASRPRLGGEWAPRVGAHVLYHSV